MKNRGIRLFAVLLFAFGIMTFVSSTVQSLSFGETKLLAGETGTTSDPNCKALLGNPDTSGTPAYYLQTVLDIIKYAGIVLCIVLTVVDFFNALTNDDKDLLKPLTQKALKRLIYAVMLFFIPIIIKMIFMLVDIYGACGIS